MRYTGIRYTKKFIKKDIKMFNILPSRNLYKFMICIKNKN